MQKIPEGNVIRDGNDWILDRLWTQLFESFMQIGSQWWGDDDFPTLRQSFSAPCWTDEGLRMLTNYFWSELHQTRSVSRIFEIRWEMTEAHSCQRWTSLGKTVILSSRSYAAHLESNLSDCQSLPLWSPFCRRGNKPLAKAGLPLRLKTICSFIKKPRVVVELPEPKRRCLSTG